MKNFAKKFTDTDIRVNCRLSYAHLFTPRAMAGGDPKYQVTLLVDKDDEKAVSLIREAEEAAKKLYVEKYGKFSGKLKSVVYDGDEEFPNDANCENKIVVRTSSYTQPGLKVLEAGVLADALDDSDVYSGCYAVVEFNLFPYSQTNSKGISAGLNNVCKIEDGERLGGGSRSADDAFGDLC